MWKNLKSLFIVEEEENDTKPTKTGTAPAKSAPASKAATRGSAKPVTNQPATKAADGSAVTPPSGQISERFTKLLLEAMDKADLPGFDYLEYKKALQNLRKMDMDEATRFTSAFTVAQSMGVTPQSLLDSANHYLEVLAKEERQFQHALQQNRQAQVGDKLDKQKVLSNQITDKEKQIKALQTEIKKLDGQREKLKKQIDQATTKLQRTEADFKKTLERVRGQIQGDLGKMKDYLG